jgi:hypothetical protein
MLERAEIVWKRVSLVLLVVGDLHVGMLEDLSRDHVDRVRGQRKIFAILSDELQQSTEGQQKRKEKEVK